MPRPRVVGAMTALRSRLSRAWPRSRKKRGAAVKHSRGFTLVELLVVILLPRPEQTSLWDKLGINETTRLVPQAIKDTVVPTYVCPGWSTTRVYNTVYTYGAITTYRASNGARVVGEDGPRFIGGAWRPADTMRHAAVPLAQLRFSEVHGLRPPRGRPSGSGQPWLAPQPRKPAGPGMGSMSRRRIPPGLRRLTLRGRDIQCCSFL